LLRTELIVFQRRAEGQLHNEQFHDSVDSYPESFVTKRRHAVYDRGSRQWLI